MDHIRVDDLAGLRAHAIAITGLASMLVLACSGSAPSLPDQHTGARPVVEVPPEAPPSIVRSSGQLVVPPVMAVGPYPHVLVLDGSDPPSDLPVVHVANARSIIGQEAPSITPERDLDYVIDPREAPPFEATLLYCPAARVEAVEHLWVRDNLGDGLWRAAVAVQSSSFIGGAEPCAEGPRFVAASPAAIVLGRHATSIIRLGAAPSSDLPRLAAALPPPWGPRDGNIHAFVPPFEGVRLVRVFVDTRWQLVALHDDGTASLVADAASNVVDVVGIDRVAVPLALCIEGRAVLLEGACGPHSRVCAFALRDISACTSH